MSRLGFYSLIPGLILFFLGILFYQYFNDCFLLSDAMEVYADLLNADGKFKKETIAFLDNDMGSFVLFNFCTYFSAAFFGFLFHYIIQKWDLDKKSKLLRFKNYWYYVFSGEILKFKKFIQASSDVHVRNINDVRDSIITYGDILCNINGQEKLYTGYIVDYELDSDNMHHLDKLYILDAKYSKVQKNPGLINLPRSERKSIVGDLFVVDYKHVINLNLTYVPSSKRIDIKDEKRLKSMRRASKFFEVLKFVLILTWVDTIWTNLFINGDLLSHIGINEFYFKILLSIAGFTFLTVIFHTIHYKLTGKVAISKEARLEQKKIALKNRSNPTENIKLMGQYGPDLIKLRKFKEKRRELNRMRNAALYGTIFFVITILVIWFVKKYN